MSSRSLSPVVAAAIVLAGASPAHALPNKIVKIDVPANVKAGKRFVLSFDVQFDLRTHRPPYAYLKAALLRTRGTAACPKGLPMDRKGWTTVLTHDVAQDPEPSARVEITSGDTLEAAGRYRYCGYVYTDSYTTTSLLPVHHVKKRASKVVRGR